jgi:CRISPR-associated protein Cas1
MPPVYVVQQGARLRVDNRRLSVEREEEVLLQVPLGQVSQVVLFGNISLTTPAMVALLAQASEVVFLSERGEYRGRLVGAVTPHVPLRRAQYRRLEEPAFVLAMAQGFVAAKLAHLRALLLRHNREQPDEVVTAAGVQLNRALAALPRKTALTALRGLEGAASAAYFRSYRRLFGPQWSFARRARRPPPDPVNVLLSFGYTLLAQAAAGAVQSAGLDPFAGFLHEVAYNRPALGLDLMEEFRPVVDGIVLWCCRGGQITPEDFTPGPEDRPVVLSEAGLRRFVQAYEGRMDQPFTHPQRGIRLPLRQCLVEQARQVATRLQEGPAGYRGMGFR